MLDTKTLEKIQNTYQTTFPNVVREYAQHLFLSSFYRIKNSENILFKGGTAIRIVYKSPRFSEDLDFSASKVDFKDIEKIVLDTLVALGNYGFICDIDESKETTGGYLANLTAIVDKVKTTIKIQISFRDRKNSGRDNINISNEYLPTYVANLVPEKELIGEKIQAALTRTKPRDIFDIYFLLKQRLIPPEEIENLRKMKDILAKKEIDFNNELSFFLPKSMKYFIKSFPQPLLAELDKFF